MLTCIGNCARIRPERSCALRLAARHRSPPAPGREADNELPPSRNGLRASHQRTALNKTALGLRLEAADGIARVRLLACLTSERAFGRARPVVHSTLQPAQRVSPSTLKRLRAYVSCCCNASGTSLDAQCCALCALWTALSQRTRRWWCTRGLRHPTAAPVRSRPRTTSRCRQLDATPSCACRLLLVGQWRMRRALLRQWRLRHGREVPQQ